jgi:FAD:protein FMN transferase
MRRVLVPLDLPPALQLPTSGAVVRHLGGPTMGTTWSVKMVAQPALACDSVRATIERVLSEITVQMSTWIAGSEISSFNRAPPGTWHELSPEFHKVLCCALNVAADTAGCYDPAIGALVDVWGFGPPGPRHTPPDDHAIAAASALGGFRRLTLGPGRTILQPGGLQLDLSSVAKGFAVDRVSEALGRLGIGHHLVEIGGELRGSGIKPDGSPWWITLEEPSTAGGDVATSRETVVALHGLSVATSGDAWRSFEWNGRRWSHTIDPRDGRPVAEQLASVTVLHNSCMHADALATALTVLGPDAGFDYAQARGLAARFVVRRFRQIDERMTTAFAAMLN